MFREEGVRTAAGENANDHVFQGAGVLRRAIVGKTDSTAVAQVLLRHGVGANQAMITALKAVGAKR